MLAIVEKFTEELTAGNAERAVGIAKELPSMAKEVARDIWGIWRGMVAGSNLPACPF